MNNSEWKKNGPWIEKVESLEELSKSYQQRYNDSNNFKYLFMIPKNTDKMDEEAKKEPYRGVIGIYEDHLYMINEVLNNDYTEEKVYYKDILYIKHSILLLDGEFSIYTAKGYTTIVYNSVSSELMKMLENLIREKYIGEVKKLNFDSLQTIDYDDLEYYQKTIVKKLGDREKKLSIIAYQSNVEKTDEGDFLHDLIHGLHKTYLLGFVCLHNEKEIIIVGRDKHYESLTEVNYSSSVIYIPFKNVEGVKEVKSQNYEGFEEFRIDLIGNSVDIVFEEGNSSKDRFKELF